MVVGTSTGQAVVTKCRSISGSANIWYVVCGCTVAAAAATACSVTWCIQLLLYLNRPASLTAHTRHTCMLSRCRCIGDAQAGWSSCCVFNDCQASISWACTIGKPTATQSSLWRALTVLFVLRMVQFDCRFIRGNKRSGFDFELDLEWQQGSSTADAQGARGTLKVPSAGPDDLDDLHIEVSIDAPTGDRQADEAARQAAKQLKQPLQDLLEQFLTELRSR